MKTNQIIDTLKYEENKAFILLLNEDLTEVNNTKNMRAYAAKRRGLKLKDFKNSIQAAVQVEMQLTFNEAENNLIFFDHFKHVMRKHRYNDQDFKFLTNRIMRIAKQYVKSLIKYQQYLKGNVRKITSDDKQRIEIMFVEDVKDRIKLEAKRFPEVYKDKDLKLLGNKIVKKFVSEIDPVVFDSMMLEIVKDIVNTLFEIYKNSFVEKAKNF